MAEPDDVKPNGVFTGALEEPTLDVVFHRMLTEILYGSAPVRNRVKASLSENVPLLREASSNTGRHVLRWARRGSPLRALLVISGRAGSCFHPLITTSLKTEVGTIALLTLSGLGIFMLFFLAATVNAVIISLLVSLAAAGGFLAICFACVVTVYIVALSVAAFVISAITIPVVVAAIITSGWIGFFCAVWLGTKKSVGLAKHSVRVTGSALSAYSHARRHPVPDKFD